MWVGGILSCLLCILFTQIYFLLLSSLFQSLEEVRESEMYGEKGEDAATDEARTKTTRIAFVLVSGYGYDLRGKDER